MGVNWTLNSQSRRLPEQPARLPCRRSNHLRHLGSNRAGAVQGNAEFNLNEFFDDNIPTYAILSHTWAVWSTINRYRYRYRLANGAISITYSTSECVSPNLTKIREIYNEIFQQPYSNLIILVTLYSSSSMNLISSISSSDSSADWLRRYPNLSLKFN
jgi:hypothetical protein